MKPGEEASAGVLVSTEQDNLGGKVRIMVTGAAPISSSVLEFLRAAMGCPVSQAPLKPQKINSKSGENSHLHLKCIC